MKSSLHRDASVANPVEVRGHQALMLRTPEVILGPFYPADRLAPRTSDLTNLSNVASGAAGAAGDQILVSLRISDEDGNSLESVCAEFWQANASGRYRHVLDEGPAPLDSSFDGFGSQITDARGRLLFKTVKPGAYRTPLGETRAPHIHFQVTDGARRLVTQMFLPGEPLNVQDRCLQSCRHPAMLIARAIKPTSADVPEFSWQIVLSRRTLVPLSFHALSESQK
jgi:protocatechuate 3,4-dioxygenase beta subunit